MLQFTQKRISGDLRCRALKDLLAQADNEVEANTNFHRTVRLLVYEGPPIFQQATYSLLGIAMGYCRVAIMPTCHYSLRTEGSVVALAGMYYVHSPNDPLVNEIVGLSGLKVPVLDEHARKMFNEGPSNFKKPSLWDDPNDTTAEYLVTGAAAYVNDDCTNPAITFAEVVTTEGAYQMRAVLLRDVHRGEELTIAYGPKFFANEASCISITCEEKAENGWTTVVDGEISDKEGKLEAERLLDLRPANLKEIAIQTHVFPDATDEWRVRGLPRRRLDHIDLIPIGQISTCPDCGFHIAGLKKKRKFLCCSCLQKEAVTTPLGSVLHRYFSTLLKLSDDDPSSPLTREGQTICSITSFLESFEAPEGWGVFPQPIVFFSEVEKAGIYQSILFCEDDYKGYSTMSRYCKELRRQIGFASTCDDATPSEDGKGTIFWITYAPGVDDGSAGPDEVGQLRMAVNEAHTWLLFHKGNKICIHYSVT